MSDPYRVQSDAQRKAREAAERAERLAKAAAGPLARDIRGRGETSDRAKNRERQIRSATRRKAFRESVIGPGGQYFGLFAVWLLPFAALFAIVMGYIGHESWPIGVGVLGVVVIFARLLVVRWLVERERRWLSGLPFGTRGY